LFHKTASKLVQKWKEVIAADPSGQPIVNVTGWFSRAALDVIGEAGFDFQFESLDDMKNSLALRNEDMFIESSLYPPWYDVIFKNTWKYIPGPLLEYVRYLPMREYRGFRSWLDNVRKFSKVLIKQSMVKGDGNDIMSILPLAFPITTNSGEQISSIPINKGTPIDISPIVYNR